MLDDLKSIIQQVEESRGGNWVEVVKVEAQVMECLEDVMFLNPIQSSLFAFSIMRLVK